MSVVIVAFIAALSISTWAYFKLQNHTGYGNGQTTAKAAVAVFVIAFVVVLTLARLTFHQ